jgi:hypothetical protein
LILVLKSIAISAIFSAVAVLLHAWSRPYGLFLALLVIVAMMRYISSLAIRSSIGKIQRRIPALFAAAVWFSIAWVASTVRNGDEILIEGDTIGSSFLVGASAFIALALLARPRSL